MSGRLKALYVDDEPDIREIAVMALTLDQSFTVETAASSEEALARLNAGDFTPDIILLDVMMPGVDGPNLLKKIRQIPALDATPIVFITARTREVEQARFIAQGAVGVITKPFDPMTLARQVRAFVP